MGGGQSGRGAPVMSLVAKVVVKVEDVQGTPWCVSHLLWGCSNLGQDPKDEQQAHDDDVAYGRNNDRMS